MANSELKPAPCPFCGCTNTYPLSPSLGRSSWTVFCDDCQAEGPTLPSYNTEDPEVVCVLAWNNRPDVLTHSAEILGYRQSLADIANGLALLANPVELALTQFTIDIRAMARQGLRGSEL